MASIHVLDAMCSKFNFDVNKIASACDVTSDVVRKRIKELKQYQKQLDGLLKIPKVLQKTDEWYSLRQNMITASDFAQALGDGKFGTVKQFYQKKCEPLHTDEAMNSKVNPFFKWGNMFEPVAIDIYASINNVIVHEFGLLKHPTENFFGASPDGISSLGIMVEIKCPRKRKINGEVPKQYYYQIQGQLDVCGLKECDYFECEFVEMQKVDFYDQFDLHAYKGIIVEHIPSQKMSYTSLVMSKEEMKIWEKYYNDSDYYLCYYWCLGEYNLKRVQKDDDFTREKLQALKTVWNNIQRYMSNRQAYELEVLKSVKIETEKYNKPFDLNTWSFIEQD